ncbi:hypothetical protein JVT61DRAFT_2879 [Boletus reticuloceps]|uniref:DNA 3'-5' helicase n=1 Tax=Boletus reticuloceps TaxID=495285 RepID=A0A8I3AB33_9AGAM|nr:hypothetical protein JVT61DRAFT_2879 [Boletus reticuloceps]
MTLEQQALNKIRELLQQNNLHWRSKEQKEAMMATLQGRTDVFTILPTGEGKSMLAVVPSLLELNKTMVLVVPLNALIMDYKRRLQDMHVPYRIYDFTKDLNIQDHLIIVSADKSQMTPWCSTLADHAHHKTVAQIVMDKSHIPLTTTDYCKSLSDFYNIGSEPVQLVLLSATLPPSFMPILLQTYQLLTNVSIHRQSTNHGELKYILEKMSSEDSLVSHAIEIVERQVHTYVACP